MPYRSECNLRRSVKLWLQAPRTEDFARFEEKPEKVVPFTDAEVAPLPLEERKGLFRIDLVGRTINVQRSRNSSVGVCLESQRWNKRNIRSMPNNSPNTRTSLECHTPGQRRCHSASAECRRCRRNRNSFRWVQGQCPAQFPRGATCVECSSTCLRRLDSPRFECRCACSGVRS